MRFYLCNRDPSFINCLPTQVTFLLPWVWFKYQWMLWIYIYPWIIHFCRTLCRKYRQHYSPISRDLQLAYVIFLISRMCSNWMRPLLAIFEDISLSNVSSIPVFSFISTFGILNDSIKWLALTPPALVQAHLGFDMKTIASLPKTKPIVVGPVWASLSQ